MIRLIFSLEPEANDINGLPFNSEFLQEEYKVVHRAGIKAQCQQRTNRLVMRECEAEIGRVLARRWWDVTDDHNGRKKSKMLSSSVMW
jgi:hypothetical protein